MYLIDPNLIVVSGGPGSGKTTLLLQLGAAGFAYAPEVARQIIQEQVQSGGTALPWGDRKAYTQLMLKRSIKSFREHTPAAAPIFSDRGIPDALCYARLIGLDDTRCIEAACRRYRYAPQVFLAPPWPEIYRTDSERKQDFAEAVRTYEQMTEVYLQFGYEVIVLPKVSPEDRAQFVLSHVPGVRA